MSDLLNSDAFVALVTGVLSVIGIVVGEMLRRQHNALKAVREDTAAARVQTENTHSTNLRDDIDRVIGLAERLVDGQERHERDLRRHGDELANLTLDSAWLRREHMDLLRRVDRLD